MVLAPDFLLQAVNLRGEEFDRAAALGADHVMMAAAVVLVLVARDPVVKGNLTSQSAFGQQLQRSINGRKPNTWIALPHQLMELFGGKMLMGLQEGE